ncbi:MAG: glycoside hydrolase family 3 protein, partial [Candidatus Hydrogenedentes bacterium]|nr:glycoside hydrolase family 3 protein [Candidatus Hydrogenedentota bacterium]
MRLVKISFAIILPVIASLASSPRTAHADPGATAIEQQARALVSRMTRDEKIGLIVGDGRFVPGFEPRTHDDGAGIILEDQLSQLVIPRLDIWTTPMSDGPAGLNRQAPVPGEPNPSYTTAFPTGNCLAATWNLPLVEAVGKAFGNEARAYGYDLVLAPGLNIHRNPKDGRAFEYYSEDPCLSGKMAASMVNGLQENGIGATLKHFGAHNQQTNRRTYNAVISQRALREIYLRAFEIAVHESHPACIMTSYNRMNGFYTAENPDLLQRIVRNEWGFGGFFITDFDGLGSATAKLRAGANLLMSGNRDEVEELRAALQEKTLDERTLDDRLVQYLIFKLAANRARREAPAADPDLQAHALVARDAAGEGMV